MTPRILVVEDSPTQALKLALTLEREGWEVVCASDPDQALQELNRCRPDLVITDYYLPGMRGDELCRLIRMSLQTRDLPILMLTVAEAATAELRGLESGADDYLEKAVEPERLLLKVRSLLRRCPRAAGPAGAPARRARLLVVEDSATFREFLVHELHEEGYEVDAAVGGAAALASLEHQEYDGVLVDLVMPEMDGIELCARLDRLRSEQEVCFVVVILTAHEGSEDMARALEAGADDFICKSSQLAVVKARIRGLIRRKHYQEENLRITGELRHQEMEAVRARAEAEIRAAVAEELARTNRELQISHRELQETHLQLVQAEKMASLGQLVAGLAHELNNPLAFVVTHLYNVGLWLEALEPAVVPHLNRQQSSRWSKIRTRLDEVGLGLAQVEELVLGLRTFSRLDEGEFKLVDAHESLDSVLLLLEHRLKKIALEKDYRFSGPLHCFPGQLNQVVMNVVSNALDAVEGVDHPRIAVATAEVGGRFCLCVTDNGPGISKEHADRIFEPFFTTKPVGRGTGLGMAIAYGIVAAHRGEIRFESAAGGPTRFFVEIPLDLPARLQAEEDRHGTR